MQKIIIILCLLTLTAGTALADQTSHRKLAIQLVRIYEKDIDSNYSITNEVNNLINHNPRLKPYRQALTTFMKKYLSNNQLKGYLVLAFMQQFPEGKLKEIVEFLSSPAGKLWREKSSNFGQTINNITGAVLTKHRDELMKLLGKQ